MILEELLKKAVGHARDRLLWRELILDFDQKLVDERLFGEAEISTGIVEELN